MSTVIEAGGDRPLVLLPIRLETRYTDDRQALRIRIYPDEVHVDALDPQVSSEEIAAGEHYWQAVWAGTSDKEALAGLYRRIQPRRAAWVLEQVRPVNPADRPQPPASSPMPEFLPFATMAAHPPLARGLPDNFVAVVTSGDVPVSAEGGRPVPRELPIGPTPGQRLTAGEDGLSLGEGTRWLVDYDEALEVGMAITVPIPAGVDQHALRLYVFGVRGDGSGMGELDALMRAHRFTTGLELLEVGTPTNNTEKDRSAWRRDSVPVPRPDRPPKENPDADGAALTRALGLFPSLFSDVPGAGRRSQSLARAARTALWPATFGTFLENVVDIQLDGSPIMSDETREWLRQTYQGPVSGRGPLPPLRIGRQPYGVLPVMATRRLDGTAVDVLGVPRNLQHVLLKARADLIESQVPTVFTNLLEVLGSAPVLMGLRMRALLPNLDEVLAPIVVDPFGFGATPPDGVAQAQSLLAQEYGLNFGRLGMVQMGPVTRPLLLPLVHDSDPAYVSALIADQPRSIASVLQALLEVGREAEKWPQIAALGNHQPPPDWPNADDAAALQNTAAQLAAEDGVAGTSLLATYQPFRSLVPDMPHLAEAQRQGSQAMADQALQVWARARFRSLRFDDAAAELTAAPLDQRRIAVAEALDCVSHRLDAWITSLATRRLDAIRADVPTGLTLGAYGWLDPLPRPEARTPKPGGYIHAPSQAQAVASGVLRSANLADADTGAFAIDLSSERVRTGLQVLDAVRQGQSLGAVIGYRVERALADADLERFIFSLRVLAPSTSASSADQTLAFPTSVVDGVRLLELDRADVYDALVDPPPQNPYLADHWIAPDEDILRRLDDALDQATSAYDAAADLMLAESVHQLVSGNLARASTLLDAAGSGEVAPPDPEFPRTPTTGIPVTHRLVALVADGADPVSGWATDAPRAEAEPRLEHWVESRLGPADSIVLRSGVTLDRFGLCALDVVYAASDAASLESWLRSLEPAADLASLSPVVDTAAALRAVIASARPLTADQLRSPREESASRADELAELADRLRQVAQRLAGVSDLGDSDAKRRTLKGYGIDVADLGTAIGEAARRVEQVGPLLASELPSIQALDDAAVALFGPGFVVLPLIVPGTAADEFAAALGRSGASQSQIRRLVRDASTVREGLVPYATTLLHADAFSRSVSLRVAQLNRMGGATTGWVALPFSPSNPPPDGPVTNVIVEATSELTGEHTFAGLLVDEWIEVVPRQRLLASQGSGRPEPERRPPLLASGVAVHADAPGARPPQSILVAVTPDGGNWSTELLTATLADTLQLAKLRAVTLERSTRLGWVLPAMLYPAFSLHDERILDFKYLATELQTDVVPIPFVREHEQDEP